MTTKTNELPNQEIEINKEEPFIINNGPSRETFGEFFCNFLKDTLTPSVIELSAGYGEGKTTFLKMCEQHIKNEQKQFKDIEIILLNIWKEDLYNSPLASIIKSISKLEGNQAYKDFIELLKTINIGINLGVVSLSTKDLFDDSQQQEIEKLKKAFKTIDKKIIFFIDELDRCRPDYAITTLEIIKHLFDESNIVFVLATDDNRLQSSVNSVYGSEIADEDYLRKFIDIKFNLPKIKNAETHLLSQWRMGGCDTLIKASLRELRIINYYLGNIDIMNKALTSGKIKLFSSTSKYPHYKNRWDINITSLKFMIFLRHIKPNLYFKLGNEICNVENVEEMIKKLKFNNIQNRLIKTIPEFKEFLTFISHTETENTKRLQEIFNDEEMVKITSMDREINTKYVEKEFGALDICMNVFNRLTSNKVFKDKLKQNYMLIFLYMSCIRDQKQKSIAQKMYDFIENH